MIDISFESQPKCVGCPYRVVSSFEQMNSIANNLSLIANTQLGLVLVAIITLIGLLLSSSNGAGLVRVKS